MKIQCENCAILHELDPPAWVVSSGRPFRFRCSSCGHSQSVMPETLPDDDPPPPPPPPPEPVTRSVRPADPPKPASVTPLPAGTGTETPFPETNDGAVFLKQNGQIYMVRDWDTLKRWITERRVDRHDLVSEGGVRWEPIGSRRDLAHLFGPTLHPLAEDEEPMSEEVLKPTDSQIPGNEPVDLGGSMPFEMPFMGASTGAVLQGAWHDDDTEGIPTGLPALPRQLGPGRKGASPERTPTEDPEDAFGENPTYALPPPTVDPAHDRATRAAVTAAGGMTYVAPGTDSPLPAPTVDQKPQIPNLHEQVTAPPPLAVPTAFSNAPPAGEGWDDLMVADDEDEDEEEDDEPIVFPETAPPPHIDVSQPSLGLPPTPIEVDEISYEPSLAAAWDLQRIAFVAVMALLALIMVGFSTWYVRNTRQPTAPVSVEPDAELGAVLPTDAPAPTVAAEPADPTPPEQSGTDGEGTNAEGTDAGTEPTAAPEPAVAAAPQPAPVAPAPTPKPAPAATPKPTPAPKPPPKPAPAPKPAPEADLWGTAPAPEPAAPKPAPKPAPATGASLGKLIDQGWGAVERDPKKAASLFRSALDLSATHAEANYGFGYAQLQLGDKGTAQTYLCKALSGGSVDVQREVRGLLENNQLGCN